jgi:hypothetical protein
MKSTIGCGFEKKSVAFFLNFATKFFHTKKIIPFTPDATVVFPQHLLISG